MLCALLKYVAIITFLLRLPIEIECCSMTTFDIISLMHRNPDFERDPCYIQWKAAQDAELTRLWTRREQLEKSIAENDRRRMQNEAIERENRRRSYTSSSNVSPSKKQSAIWKILGGIVGVIVGICCCAACVTAACDNDDPTTDTATNIPQNASAEAQLTSVLVSHTTADLSTFIDDNFSDLTASPTAANLPLVPRRQNSLPSYDEAVKMPSAPPIE